MNIDAIEQRMRENDKELNSYFEAVGAIREQLNIYNKAKRGGLMNFATGPDGLLTWRTNAILNRAIGFEIKRGERLYPFNEEYKYFEPIDRAMREFDGTLRNDYRAFDEIISTIHCNGHLLISEKICLKRYREKYKNQAIIVPKSLKAAQRILANAELDTRDWKYSVLSRGLN